jgi:hypothetical protein
MRGYPKHIATKKDLQVAMEINQERTKAFVRRAIDGRDGWVVTGRLDNESDGITDDTHRVVDRSSEEGENDWYQEEWGPLPGNTLDRLGITVAEAEKLAQ